jgi:hypothetical protein
MQQWNVVLIILAFAVLLSYPIWGRFLKAAINRRFARAGAELAVRQQATHAVVYARTLVLEADRATVNALADAVAAKQKATNPSPGVWHVPGFDKGDPIIVESAAAVPSDGTGTVLRVTKTVSFNGGPALSQAWTKFLEAVGARAAEQGIVARVTG